MSIPSARIFPRIAEIELETSRDGRWLLATVANGDGGEFAHYVRDLRDRDRAPWRQVTHFEDSIKQAAISWRRHDALSALGERCAPRKNPAPPAGGRRNLAGRNDRRPRGRCGD
ncbi:MAG: hypothetical protein WDN28_26705 [Chthoniobacter sp.]